MTSDKKSSHIPFLDGMRGIAILAVFLFHGLGVAFSRDQLEWSGLFRIFDEPLSFLILFPATYGHAGVAVFFVISGFCIHLSHTRSTNDNWAKFANRRILRIFPPYLLSVLVFFFLWPWGSLSLPDAEGAKQLVTHILGIHNLWEDTFFGINASFWSIAVELQLYAIYPLLLLLTRRFGWVNALVVCGVIEITIRTTGGHLPFFMTHSPFAYWLSWSLGAYSCECFLKGTPSKLSWLRPDLCLLIALLVPLFKPTASLTFLAFSLATAVAIERLLSSKPKLRTSPISLWLWKHLSFLGLVSYSFYLIHQPLIGLTGKVMRTYFSSEQVHPLVYYGCTIAWYPVVLAMAYISYRFVEKPSMNLARHLEVRFGRRSKVPNT